MENTRIGNAEAIALIITVMVNHAVLNITKSIVSNMDSSSILNTIYISIIAIILSYIIYKLLNKFPTFDILDISNFLGGKILKAFVGIAFLGYFIFFTAALLKDFSWCLQIIYYPNTNTFFIIISFLIGSIFVCNLKHNAIYRSNLITIPLVIINILVLFIGNTGNFTFENIFPILGNGTFETFFIGFSNLFAFQGLLYILFLPPHLKDVTKLKKISMLSIIFSALYLLISISIILFMFDGTTTTKTLAMPLYSAVRYIEFGSFFQRLDSVFILTWIISFVSYLSIVINICNNILKKSIPSASSRFPSIFIAFLILVVTFLAKNYAVSTFWTDIVYKYAFFTILGLSFSILIISFALKNIKSKHFTPNNNSLVGGA